MRGLWEKSMDLEVGSILEGKVTGITNFGAFVSLPDGSNGMVHISEVAHSYVSDIREHLQEGQEVKVKVLSADEGRISLSIKKAQEPVRSQSFQRPSNPRRVKTAPVEAAPPSFEDKLKQFMQESENKMSDLRAHTENRRGRGRR